MSTAAAAAAADPRDVPSCIRRPVACTDAETGNLPQHNCSNDPTYLGSSVTCSPWQSGAGSGRISSAVDETVVKTAHQWTGSVKDGDAASGSGLRNTAVTPTDHNETIAKCPAGVRPAGTSRSGDFSVSLRSERSDLISLHTDGPPTSTLPAASYQHHRPLDCFTDSISLHTDRFTASLCTGRSPHSERSGVMVRTRFDSQPDVDAMIDDARQESHLVTPVDDITPAQSASHQHHHGGNEVSAVQEVSASAASEHSAAGRQAGDDIGARFDRLSLDGYTDGRIPATAATGGVPGENGHRPSSLADSKPSHPHSGGGGGRGSSRQHGSSPHGQLTSASSRHVGHRSSSSSTQSSLPTHHHHHQHHQLRQLTPAQAQPSVVIKSGGGGEIVVYNMSGVGPGVQIGNNNYMHITNSGQHVSSAGRQGTVPTTAAPKPKKKKVPTATLR